MGRRARGRTAAAETAERRFPLLVAAACTLLAAVLLVTTTLPALGERDRVRELETTRQQLLELLATQNQELRDTTTALAYDPQALLVEIDRLGLVPDELLALSPERTEPR